MSRRPSRVTQTDIAKALRAVAQTGACVTVEIAPDGTIRLVPNEGIHSRADRSGVAKNAADVVDGRLR